MSQESAVLVHLSSCSCISAENKLRENIKNFSDMNKTKIIEDLRQAVDELSKIMFDIYVEWYASLRSPLTESERMAINMYRMMIFKAKSIGLMSQGIVITPTQKSIIPDPSTIYPVLRSMYELLFLFRCIFVSSRNDLEREILFNIWKIRGCNNLIRIPDKELNKEYKDKKEFAKVENKTRRIKIRELFDKLALSPSVIDTIENSMNNNTPALKGFMFDHCEHCDNITAFRTLDFSDSTMGLELSGASYIYSHYSAHSHPSYLGVEHFEEMYKGYVEDNFMIEILEYTCLYLGRFMEDYCKYKESYRKFYNKKESQINKLLRQLLQD